MCVATLAFIKKKQKKFARQLLEVYNDCLENLCPFWCRAAAQPYVRQCSRSEHQLEFRGVIAWKPYLTVRGREFICCKHKFSSVMQHAFWKGTSIECAHKPDIRVQLYLYTLHRQLTICDVLGNLFRLPSSVEYECPRAVVAMSTHRPLHPLFYRTPPLPSTSQYRTRCTPSQPAYISGTPPRGENMS